MKSSTNPRFIVFGDSHAGALRKGADALGVAYVGRALFSGRDLTRKFFLVRNGEIVLKSKHLPRLFCLPPGRYGSSDKGNGRLPVLSTAGFSVHGLATHFVTNGLSVTPLAGRQFISSACFEAIVLDATVHVLEFYRTLVEKGWSVYAVLSPQRFDPLWAPVARQFESVLCGKLSAMGVGIVDVRAATTNSDGFLEERYVRSGERNHGNAEFGAVVVRRFLDMVEASRVRRMPVAGSGAGP